MTQTNHAKRVCLTRGELDITIAGHDRLAGCGAAVGPIVRRGLGQVVPGYRDTDGIGPTYVLSTLLCRTRVRGDEQLAVAIAILFLWTRHRSISGILGQ